MARFLWGLHPTEKREPFAVPLMKMRAQLKAASISEGRFSFS
jgi:hypothetical protein